MEKASFDELFSIAPGKHFYHFYKNVEDYLQIVAPYFEAGILKGEACLWLVSERLGFSTVKDFAEKSVAGFHKAHSLGQIQMLPAESWYLSGGVFDEERAVENAARHFDFIQKLGYQVLRGAGDAAAIPHAEWPDLFTYEKRIAAWIGRSPVIGLCAYPLTECSVNETRTILECHDEVLLG